MLVIIGLIIGGILVGQDLIKAAAVRAQISQIDKYNSAVNAFYGKYGGLPGDLSANLAAQFGFTARGGQQGRGDGNGIIEGSGYSGTSCYGWQQAGENLFFWEDLSAAGYVDGSFNTATDTAPTVNVTASTTPSFNAYIPPAKLGNGNFVYVYSTGFTQGGSGRTSDGFNYFGISVPISMEGNLTSLLGMSVIQAYSIDKKVDDGLPLNGKIMADYVTGDLPPVDAPSNTTDNSTTCYNTTTYTYSTGTLANGGTGINCALSFQMISP